MQDSSMRPIEEIEEIVEEYGDMLYRMCFVMLTNAHDAEDAVQETMLKYMRRSPRLKDREHQKAWLLRVASNQCVDMLRKRRKTVAATEEISDVSAEESGILDALTQLPEKFRLVLVLYYVEEYRIEEIARIIGRTPSAVKMRLKKGRALLEEKYRKEYLNDE